MGIPELSPPQCILLAASLASESNISGLYKLTPARQDVFDLEILLRILLTCLPESLDPAKYITYLHETSTRIYLEQQEDYEVDCSPVQRLSEEEVRKKLRKLHLSPLSHPSIAKETVRDPLVVFLIHRAHKIEADTGLLPNVPKLLEPFLDRSIYLRDWFISAILPLIRLDYEYYPQVEGKCTSLVEFERYVGGTGVQTLLSRTLRSVREGTATDETVGRDFKGILGPWIHGSTQRKRRKLDDGLPPPPLPIGQTEEKWAKQQEQKPHIAEKVLDWQPVLTWIVEHARNEFEVAVKVVEGWDGPSDVDLGGYQKGWRLDQKEEDLREELRNEYYQCALAAIYAAQENKSEVLDGAHAILVRLARLMDFEPPPDLATSIDHLPKVDAPSGDLEAASAVEYLQAHALIAAWNPLTSPNLESFSLLQMLVYSAYQLGGLGHKASIASIAKIRFWSDSSEQLKLLTQILHGLIGSAKKTDEQWRYIRDKLLWLWHWAIEQESGKTGNGAGIFGKIKRDVMERKILEALCQIGLFPLIVRIYLEKQEGHESPLTELEVEEVIVRLLLQYYDNASNGNRTRGGMKKASDLLAAFRKHFPGSMRFRRCAALLAATHAMSFYSLALNHGVPFQPVSIRVNEDPVSLIAKILEQNQKSYTKLDDLMEIGKNLVVGRIDDSMLSIAHGSDETASTEMEEEEILNATRRITGMAIDAALAEDDFETAYSYVVNRLTPSSSSPPSQPSKSTPLDDISWRAALAAGKYRITSSSSPTTSTPSNPTSPSPPTPSLRRLSQRLDLLSHALLLAPPGPALPLVLATWRRCEEELLAASSREGELDAAHDAFADRAQPHNQTLKSKLQQRPLDTTALPGGFADPSADLGLSVQAVRRELGRSAAEEAPMGLFDVARGAAAALGRSTGGVGGVAAAGLPVGLPKGISLRGLRNVAGGLGGVLPVPVARGGAVGAAGAGRGAGAGSLGRELGADEQGHVDEAEHARVRKRDMVASAVTGGLASGIGWVLGAAPVNEGEGRR